MKKFLSLVLSLAMAFAISLPAFAAEPTTQTPVINAASLEGSETGYVESSSTFKLIPLSRETFWGDAGSCTLDYLSRGYIQWSITVPGAVIVSFEGNLHFNKLGTPFGTFNHYISSTGTSGTEDVGSELSKGKWEVTFTGIAMDIDGNMYSVAENATHSFTVS